VLRGVSRIRPSAGQAALRRIAGVDKRASKASHVNPKQARALFAGKFIAAILLAVAAALIISASQTPSPGPRIKVTWLGLDGGCWGLEAVSKEVVFRFELEEFGGFDASVVVVFTSGPGEFGREKYLMSALETRQFSKTLWVMCGFGDFGVRVLSVSRP